MKKEALKIIDRYELIYKVLKGIIQYLKEDGCTMGSIQRMLDNEPKAKKIIKKIYGKD